MTVSQQEYALLALDSYNGEGASTPHIAQSGWTRIVLNPPYDELNPEFAATAYTNDDQVVIAYRGTNGTIELLNEAMFNSVTGVPSTQILDAYNFYKAVEALHSDKTISFTGHSLGGSLAAIMSAHTGLDAQVFAPVPYEDAADAISAGYTWYILSEELGDVPVRTNSSSSPFSGIEITTVEGEVAGLLPGAPTPHLTLQSALNLSSIQKHGMALHSLILYGDDTGGSQSWPVRNMGPCVRRNCVTAHTPAAGKPPVWRSASPSTMAAAVATLRDLIPGRIGMRTRTSAAAWTSSGTPALSRPSSRVSEVEKAKST